MSDKSLIKVTNKYNCMVSGEKRMTPCAGCTNAKGCVSRTMQYKEKNIMSEKAVVKINSDGEVTKCAKGLDAGDCGFMPGAKVCGACGAMPVEGKSADGLFDDDFYEDTKGGYGAMRDEDSSDVVTMMAKKKKKRAVPMPEEEMMDEEDSLEEDDTMSMPQKKKRPIAMPDMEENEMTEDAGMEDEEEDDEEDMVVRRMKARSRRMESMGMKSADFDEDAYVCSFDRKVYPGANSPCENCPGGCAGESGMPSLLEIEGMAEEMFSGKILDSGYSDQADFYVVDIERKDGTPIEAFFDGTTGECWGWHRLSDQQMSEKSAFYSSSDIIDFNRAADIAVKSIEGEVIAVDPDVFEGFDSYVVEIEGVNGKSYDVYVGLDGEVLGYDEYEADEAEDIEAEAAEIALKRAYSDDDRDAMAKKGQALPDGSYPIKDEEDLRNAIQAYGRAKDKPAAKAHIMKRAMDLKLEDLIPMNWVPKKVQEEFAGGKKDASDEFLATLMEFEMLSAEEQSKGVLGGNL